VLAHTFDNAYGATITRYPVTVFRYCFDDFTYASSMKALSCVLLFLKRTIGQSKNESAHEPK
jgi:hypothetical protein